MRGKDFLKFGFGTFSRHSHSTELRRELAVLTAMLEVGSAPVYSGVVLSRRQTDPRLRRGSAVPLGAPPAASAPTASSGSADPGLCPSSDPARDMSTPARRRLMRDFKRPEGTPFEDVYADGSICLDILQNRWSPTYDVSSILTSIQSLLDEPNPNSPANSQAAQLYQENKREYEKRVSAIVEQSWRDC
ncbi:hypothetical protein ACRRTK_001875 [Alexandromys fortis]